MSEEVKNRLADKIENYSLRHGISISDTYALLIMFIEENIGKTDEFLSFLLGTGSVNNKTK